MDALSETEAAAWDPGAEVLTLACDMSPPEQVEAAVARVVERFGQFDVAFNAGVQKATPLHEIELADRRHARCTRLPLELTLTDCRACW